MEIQGEAEMEQGQAQLAMGQAIDSSIEKHIWLPVHDFLLRHKLLADAAGVALDVVGVVAGAVFIIAAWPEIAGGAVVIGTLGLVTGVSAFSGSIVLVVLDGIVFGLEASGNEGRAEKVENSKTVQWLRIGATVMLLPDVAVGGVRALGEIGKFGTEAREATEATSAATREAAAARDRVAKIANPGKHPGPVARRMRKVTAFERAAAPQSKLAQAAHDRIRGKALKDLGVVPGATLGGTGLLMGGPPDMVLSQEQRERDEQYRKLLAPQGGMPKDMKMEMRVSAQQKVAE